MHFKLGFYPKIKRYYIMSACCDAPPMVGTFSTKQGCRCGKIKWTKKQQKQFQEAIEKLFKLNEFLYYISKS